MTDLEKNIGHDFICGHPLPSGGRCAETVVFGKPCPVHRSLTFDQHPLPSQKCVCEKALPEIPEDAEEVPTCFYCGHDLVGRGGAIAGGNAPTAVAVMTTPPSNPLPLRRSEEGPEILRGV